MTLRIIRITPSLFVSADQFRSNLVANLSKATTRVKEKQLVLRNRVTSTWDGDKPRWTVYKGASNYKVWMVIGFAGWGEKKSGNRKWLWLSEGTEVRYVTMTSDFQAKTAHRQINSSAGSGGVLYYGGAYDGIDARYFDNEIMTRLEGSTRSFIGSAIRKTLLQ